MLSQDDAVILLLPKNSMLSSRQKEAKNLDRTITLSGIEKPHQDNSEEQGKITQKIFLSKSLDRLLLEMSFPTEITSFLLMSNTSSGLTPFVFKKLMRRSNDTADVCTGKEALDILEGLAKWTRGSSRCKSLNRHKRSYDPDLLGLQSYKDAHVLVKNSTRANDKEKFHKGMRCLKIPSQVCESLTLGGSISWTVPIF
ncbi:hypothetical protein Tco_1400128 [Tanacetum coccineum]